MLRMVLEIIDHQHAARQPQTDRAFDQTLGLIVIGRRDRHSVAVKDMLGLGIGQQDQERRFACCTCCANDGRALLAAESGIDERDVDPLRQHLARRCCVGGHDRLGRDPQRRRALMHPVAQQPGVGHDKKP